MRYDDVLVMSGHEVPWGGASGHRAATIRRQFYIVDDEERGVHLRGAYEIAQDRHSPRHRHTFEQLRYQKAGAQTYGDHEWKPGTFGYFPEAVKYGPHVSGPGGFEEIDLQLPSPTGGFFGSDDELRAAMRALRDQGVTFGEDGQVQWPDGRRQDATEACWEHLLGGEVQYAEPRYLAPVVIDTEAFPWREVAPGVTARHVGYFNEAGPNVHLVRLDPGASTEPGVLGCAQARFVVDGTASYTGQDLPEVSFLYYPPGLDYDSLSSADGATVLVVQFQVGDGEAPPLNVI